MALGRTLFGAQRRTSPHVVVGLRLFVAAVLALLASPPPAAGAGPGGKGPGVDDLRLPVRATADLSHVRPEHFAAALDKDPQKVFEFVRDRVAFEAYAGCLRGPRGTLLAMAGNAVDRAALLAAMLEAAGHKVRFAHGPLPEPAARDLVGSMWDARPSARGDVAGAPPPELAAAITVLKADVQRDFQLVFDMLKQAGRTRSREAAPDVDSLAPEVARSHWWVQWWHDGRWVDMDPSFADAAVGRRYADDASVTPAKLPPELYHRVKVRVRVEEHPVLADGSKGDAAAWRDVLSFESAAADLAGEDLLLTHQPENWTGPAEDVAAAVAAAVRATARIKPVFVHGERFTAGEAFHPKLAEAAGVGGVGGLLSGAGTRSPIPVALAESIHFEFTAPGGGRPAVVVRDVIDLCGPARRIDKAAPSPGDATAMARAGVGELTQAIYCMTFLNGRLNACHIPTAAPAPGAAGAGVADPDDGNVGLGLRQVNLAHAALSDALLERLGQAHRAVIRFYPDTPRVLIAEVSAPGGRDRLSLDLRRDAVTAVAQGPHPEDAYFARIFRGVSAGALERVVMACLIESAGAAPDAPKDTLPPPAFSTARLFEAAKELGVPFVLVGDEEREAPPAAYAKSAAASRMRAELSAGHLLVAPERAVDVLGQPRTGWWRIDPRTGDTTAVTDEGLHQVNAEYTVVRGGAGRPTAVIVTRRGVWFSTRFFTRARDLERFVRALDRLGATDLGTSFVMPGG